MALPIQKSCLVKLDDSKLKDNNSSVNVLNSNSIQDPNCNHSLNPYGHSEIISDPTLDYISQYLLEEDIDENILGYQEKALREMEKPFYDVLGITYPPSPNNQLSLSPPKGDQRSSTFLLEDQATKKVDEILLACEFQKGVEEGMKFLPTIHKLTVDLQASRLSSDLEQTPDRTVEELRTQEEEAFGFVNRSKGKKNSRNANFDSFEVENYKRPILCNEEAIRDDMFDKVLLDHGENHEKQEISGLREIMQHNLNSFSKEIQDVDIYLNNLLISCSEAVSINNRQVADELLRQIRKRSSQIGSGTRRLASILADGLEARLAGSGSELYRRLVAKRINTADILKAFYLYMRIDPFVKVSYCFANTNILTVIENASRVHIVDLGISFGFQWPPLIQSLATRQGGPPKLRITGIDFPQRGFRPTNQVDEIGRRLEDYARNFNVPFEYQGIASEWESISIEDLNLREDEVCIVNSTLKFSRVRDEACKMDCPRNQVLNLIRQMKPQIFIQVIFNAAFSSFFELRFKQVLSCYSVLLDVFDSLVPQDNEQRQLLGNEFLAPTIINLIACEGSDWLEKPETYKNWQLRNVRAGFKQLPLDPDVVNKCRKKLGLFDKRFFIEEDGKWLLQGCKGRISYAHSTWKPKAEL
ncbi:GRAS transcription factor [Rhynchospora pubera]|uniref:GRAS transcription factor n=1 Tax=Rhynchospora pubera TaxID=906938 RepID=A0AAV8EXQ8_9POAL|nr:GRAS transcription factor [Rhynchospora pubera]